MEVSSQPICHAASVRKQVVAVSFEVLGGSPPKSPARARAAGEAQLLADACGRSPSFLCLRQSGAVAAYVVDSKVGLLGPEEFMRLDAALRSPYKS